MTSVGELRAEALCPRGNFTPERWARWVADMKVFTDTPGGPGVLKRAIEDRGYNGTPTHSALSGFLANRIPLTIATHNMVPLLDVAMVSAMLYAAAVAFGWKIGLLFALSVFAMAADRWGIIGGSWLRYAWFVTLTLGIVALKRGRYGLSGAMLALSTALNVFPVLFAAGVILRGLATCWEERRLVRRYRDFVLAGVVTGLVALGIGLLPARHLDNYTGWAANMSQHNVERFQGLGIGLKFPFIYRGGNTSEADRADESDRRALFHQNRKAYYPLATLLVLIAGAFALRTRDDVEAATILGFTLFFCFFGTVGYYFACGSLLVLGLHRRASTPGGTIFVALWFLSSLLAHWALYETLYYRFTYNTVISLTWTVWLTGLLFWLAAEEGLLARAGRLVAAPASGHSPD
jgi:hypothetical protein